MRFLVTFKVLQSVSAAFATNARDGFKRQFDLIQHDPRVIEGGVFTDARGGFFLCDLEDAKEFWQLIGSMSNLAEVDIHAVTGYQDLIDYLSANQRREATEAGPQT